MRYRVVGFAYRDKETHVAFEYAVAYVSYIYSFMHSHTEKKVVDMTKYVSLTVHIQSGPKVSR